MVSLAYDVNGKGQPIIFIHGFPMNRKIWKGYSPQFQEYKTIALDLPGFGDSPIKTSSFSINDIANDVIDFIRQEKISNPIIVGHSLGGYVALAVIRNSPELVKSLVLFHSTAYPDSEEKKESRNKVIDFIKKNGVEAFTSNFITSLFADPRHPAIELVRAISMEATEQAVINYTMAMRDRPDSTESLKNFGKPVLFIGGEKDAGISPDSLHRQASSASHAEVFILKETAHMGMFETVDQTLQKIHAFISEN